MSEERSSYRQIVKATSLFGGVQIFNILIKVIQAKFIAILLGPTGMGIAGLLTSTIGVIESVTNFGLRTSAVKNVATENGTGNITRVSIVVKVLRRLVWITGSLGMIVTIALSPWLSEMAFGNRDYTYAFMWISVSLLFTQISSGQQVVLQGMRKLKHIAKATLIGSSLGLIITVPLYYWLGINGIVPAIVITSLIALFGSWYFSRKVELEKVEVSKQQTIAEGKGMLIMGFMISFTGIYATIRFYLLRIFIRNIGGIAQVGLYNAGLNIINIYAGLIFSAMTTDYYPRLAAVAHDNIETKKLINQQAIIALLLLGPLMAIFVVFSRWILILLYSNRFLDIGLMLQWASLGMLFRAASWSISFVFMAKGDASLFFKNEFIAGLFSFSLYLLGYYLNSLTGIGIAFLVFYFYYTVQVYIIAKWKYEFGFTFDFIRIFIIQMSFLVLTFVLFSIFKAPWSYIIGTFLIAFSGLFSFKELDKRIGIKELLSKFKK